jgi:hypothetical protein
MKKGLWTITLGLLLIGINGYAGDGDLIVNGKLGLRSTTPAGIFEVFGMVSSGSGSAIPTLTSNTSNGTASADSAYSTDYEAWRAMDKDNSSYFCWYSAATTFPHWLQYRFTSGKTITSYSITSRNYAGSPNPTAWKLQGSNNGSSWTDLDTRTNQSFNANEKKTFSMSNSTSYTYYRLYITAGTNSAHVGIGEFELMESVGTTLTSLFYVDETTGHVGIWTTNPGSYKLYVNGGMYASNYSSGSDKRLKKNIKPIDHALSLVEKLQGVRFEWKTEEFKDRNFENGVQVGLIAQDVELVIPEIVKTDNDGYKAIAYDKLTAVLLEAIKEQNKRIKALEAKISKIKKK